MHLKHTLLASPTRGGSTALHIAARAGNSVAVATLLGARCDPELRDRWHRTALHWAVVNGQLGAATLLVAAGATVNGVPMPIKKHLKKTSLPLEAPLHSAARLNPASGAQMIELLLRAKADPNLRDQFGQTAMQVAQGAGWSPAQLSLAWEQQYVHGLDYLRAGSNHSR
eukprot:6192585-Pleurochrysis_carterae.AAC.1